AERERQQVATFCCTLAYSGCRISEALALTSDRVDLHAGVLVFESLKKRRKGVFRAVPVPPYFLETLAAVHGLSSLHRAGETPSRLWSWSRPTGWRYVHSVMQAAGVNGLHASPKGLRHG